MPVQQPFDPFAPELESLAWIAIDDIATAVGGKVYGGDATVRGAVIDNRAVRGGELFITMPGFHVHGARFAPDAAQKGAGAILTDSPGMAMNPSLGIPMIVVPDVPSAAGKAAALAWGNPAEKLQLWGVTGTNGKTTVTYLLRHLLHRLGELSTLVGTVEVAVGKNSVTANITTPQASQVQAVAVSSVQADVKNLVLEVSSHALGMGRVDPLHFTVTGFTNLSQDHLDYHRTMEDYFQTKASLFSASRSESQVILVDDEWGKRLAEQLERSGQHNYVTLSSRGEPADWNATITEQPDGYYLLKLEAFDGKNASVPVLMPGAFNAVNVALAIVMVVTGRSPSPRQISGDVLRHLTAHPIQAEVPGRMEQLSESPRVIVDFAHNPVSLETLLKSLRPSTVGKLILVNGADGQRDTEKRPVLGRLSTELADYLYLTDADIHEEDPAKIRREMISGIDPNLDNWSEVPNREDAIRIAISQAKPEDTVVIAGRGHEPVQETPTGTIDLDDRVVARAALQTRAEWV